MKLFENCKVAVCLVGQSRTFKHCAESINHFFSSDRGNQYYFFGHTWDTNTYKTRVDGNIVMVQEQIDDRVKLEEEIRNCLKLEKLIVEHEIYRPYSWASVFYSTMRSNFLKQQYEAENNMMFDMVIKARFDVGYRPDLKFENCFHHPIQQKVLYSDHGHMNHEFFLPNPDDVIYYGSSLTMDLIDSFYNAICTRSFNKLVGTNIDNITYDRVGPGILIYKWMAMKNIMPINNIIPHAVYRKQSVGLDYKTDWNRIQQISGMVF